MLVDDAGPGMPPPYLGRGHSQGGCRIADRGGGSVELTPSTLGGLCVTVRLAVHRDAVATTAGPVIDH